MNLSLNGTSVTINNSEIYSVYGGGIEAAGGTVVLNNVKVEQEGMYIAPYNSMAISVNGGGTFDKTGKSWLIGAATGKDITFVVNGGTFRGYVNMPEMTVDTFRPYSDPIVVCGGTFNFAPTNWVPDGYTATKNAENSTWTVK